MSIPLRDAGTFTAHMAKLETDLTNLSGPLVLVAPAVMAPSDLAARKTQMRTIWKAIIDDDTFSGAGSVELKKSLKAISANNDALELLLLALTDNTERFVSAEFETVRHRVDTRVAAVSAPLASAIQLTTSLSTDAALLLAGQGTGAPATLRVSGTTGVSEPQARSTWQKMRLAMADLDDTMIQCRAKVLRNQRRLQLDEICAVDKAVIRLEIRDCQALEDATLLEMYTIAGCEGRLVKDDSSDYSNYPSPKTFSKGNYEAHKAEVKRWRYLPATIKRHHRILHHFDYIYSAVDVGEAMHLLPPDVPERSKDGWIPDGAVSPKSIDNEEQAFARFYSELIENSSQEIKEWADHDHAIGQSGALIVTIKENDSMRFVYAMLSEFVKFTKHDQSTHFSNLMQLHSKFANGAVHSPLVAISKARLELKAARQVGVLPDYNTCAKKTIMALARVDTEIRQAFVDAELLDDKIRKRTDFNASDCKAVLEQAFTLASSTIHQHMKLDDGVGTGTRAAPQARYEIGALAASSDTSYGDLDSKKAKWIQHSLRKSDQHRSIDQTDHEQIFGYMACTLQSNDKLLFGDVEEQVEACALMLTNGVELSEPKLRSKIKDLRTDANWRKRRDPNGKRHDDKPQKPKSKKRRRDDEEHDRKGKPRAPRCPVQGCRASCGYSTVQKKNFRTCRECHLKLRSGSTLTTFDGDTIEAPRASGDGFRAKRQRVDANVMEVSFEDTSGKRTTQTVCRDTIKILRQAQATQSRMVEEQKETDKEALSMLIDKSQSMSLGE
jgi:hypothetical protein